MDSRADGPIEIMARLGYGALGAVYCLIGGLAVLAAFGSGGKVGGSRSALETLLGEPFGKVLLGIVALGLFCFAAWRIVEPVTDADHLGRSAKGLLVRLGHLVSSIAYIALGLSCLGLVFGWSGGKDDDQSTRDWTAWLLDKPFGPWLVGLAGAVVVGIGLGLLWKGWNRRSPDYLALSPEVRHWAVPLGRIGNAARGVVFVLVGVFLIIAAIDSSSSEAKGLGGALRSLQAQPYGWALLAATASGLVAFGIFAFVQAMYRDIENPDLADLRREALQALPH